MSKKRKLLLIRPVLNHGGRLRSFLNCVGRRKKSRSIFEVLTASMGLTIKQEALKHDIQVIDLFAEKATKEQVNKALEEYPEIELIVFLGLADREGRGLRRLDNRSIIDESNIHLSKGRGCYFVCCHAGGNLGIQAMRSGAKFFLGYKKDFHLVPNEGESIVSECAISGLLGLLSGLSAMDAFMLQKEKHRYWIEQLEQRQDQLVPNWFIAASVLKANFSSSVIMLSDEPLTNNSGEE